MKERVQNKHTDLQIGHGYASWVVSIKMSTYEGYNVGVAFALSTYFIQKEKAFKAAKREREGRRGLLRVQRLEGGF